MDWGGWPVSRILILFVGVEFLLLFVQVTLFHSRQNFRHWSMWIPVVATPIFGVLSLLLVFFNVSGLRTVLTVCLAIGVVAGMYGTFLHYRGVGKRVGGYALRNFMTGPPVILPGLVSGVSILGLIALFWR